MATRNIGTEMQRVVREVYSASEATDAGGAFTVPGNLDLVLLADLAAEDFDASATLERLIEHAHRD